MKKIASLVLMISVLPSLAFARADYPRDIESFSVIRTGGGETEIKIKKGTGDIVFGQTVTCGFRTLDMDEQAKTRFILTGADAADALAIFAQSAVLTEEKMLEPLPETGSWTQLSVAYSYDDFAGKHVTAKLDIANPFVIVDGKVSPVYEQIESVGRKANAKICK